MKNKWNTEQAWELADIIGKSYAIISALSDKVAKAEGITSSQMIALAILDGFPDGLSQTSWGRYQTISRQRASIVAQGLEAEGLVRCVPEGRKSTVSITAKGRRRVQKYKKIFGSAMKEKLSTFSARDGAQLAKLLDKLVFSLEKSES